VSKTKLPQAPRRDAPVNCPVCGRTVRRRARHQIYCGVRCRKRAHYARAVAEGKFARPASHARYHPSRDGTNPPKNSKQIKLLRGQKTEPTGSFDAPLNLLGGGHRRWPGAPTLEPAVKRAILIAEIGDRIVQAGTGLAATEMSNEDRAA
jgi:hypothetical protein